MILKEFLLYNWCMYMIPFQAFYAPNICDQWSRCVWASYLNWNNDRFSYFYFVGANQQKRQFFCSNQIDLDYNTLSAQSPHPWIRPSLSGCL